MASPYEGYSVIEWDRITEDLIAEHPLSEEEIVDAVLDAWDRIKLTKIGGELQIGVDVFPSPQIMGNYLHELIPVMLAYKYPGIWRKEHLKDEKDMVYIPDDFYSVEIKTSSNATNIYGNRSYGQENSENNSGKKKYGYYITVNFEQLAQIIEQMGGIDVEINEGERQELNKYVAPGVEKIQETGADGGKAVYSTFSV